MWYVFTVRLHKDKLIQNESELEIRAKVEMAMKAAIRKH